MSHTSTTPAAKRRRLDTASRTLARPFHSPFKTPSKPPPQGLHFSDAPTPSDPSHAPAEIAALEAQIATLQQAVDIVTSKKDAELDVQIEKWRGVAREAAEGMFEGAKARVDGMGGVRAMKRTRREIRRGEDEGPEETEGEDEDEEFTMDMMLQTLNIDLDLIGYDAVAQRWRE